MSEEDTSHGMSMFMKLHKDDGDRFYGNLDSSYAMCFSMLQLNIAAFQMNTKETAIPLCKTSRGDTLPSYMLTYGANTFERVEDSIAHLAWTYEDETASERAYNLFNRKPFEAFRQENDVKRLSEIEAIKLLHSTLLTWQLNN